MGPIVRPSGTAEVEGPILAPDEEPPPPKEVPKSARAIRWARKRRALGRFWRQYRRSPMGMIGLALLLFFIGVALFAVFFANPAATDPTLTAGPVLAPPSWHYLLGTDDTGISVLSLVIAGSKTSLLVGLAATVISMVLGTVVGIAAGYRAGWLDAVLMRITDMFLVLPWLALAIVLAAVLGQSLPVIIGIIGFTSWPITARLVRAQVLSVKEHQFVERGRALGAKDWHVVTRHVLPNVMPVIFSNTILTVAIAILSESALSFLGLGDPFNVTWGTIIEFAFDAGATSIGAWWWLLAPSFCIVLVVLAFTLCGFAFDEIINPRLRQRQ
jgi:peptide/nickel transport system permease protein